MSVTSESKHEQVDPFVRKLLVGEPVYVDDVHLKERVAYLGLVRSPYANARIGKIDRSNMDGSEDLLDFISGEDLARQGIHHIPVLSGEYTIRYDSLALEKVSYVGEPVAAVLAPDSSAAEDLIDQLVVEYDVAEPVCTVEMSKLASTKVQNNMNDNLLFSARFNRNSSSQSQEKSAEIKGKSHTMRARFKVSRQAAVPIETRAILSNYDEKTESYTVYATVQQPQAMQDVLSKALNVSAERITVKKSALGGAFGAKGDVPFTEALLSCVFARRNPGLAIKWVSSRTEDLLESAHGRDKSCELELTCGNDGKIRELRANIEADSGVFEVQANGILSVLNTSRLLPGVYRLPSIDIEAHCYVTNKSPCGPIRDAGKAEACFFIERAIDRMARNLVMDPVEFRKKNLIKPEEFPYDNGAGCFYDSGDYSSLLDALLQASDYESLKVWRDKVNSDFKDESNGDGKLAGLGISLAVEDVTVSTKSKVEKEALPKSVKTFPSGAHLCALLVAAETGTIEIKKYVVVDDYGPALNLAFADGRIQGGLGREIGAALFEEIDYVDAQPLNPNLMDYLISTAQTVPNVGSVHLRTPSPLTENGSKGLGEIGTIGVMAAISNAIDDAISNVCNSSIDRVPVTPEEIVKLLRG